MIDGQKYVEEVGYVPLSEDVINEQLQKLEDDMNIRRLKDLVASKFMFSVTILSGLIVFLIAVVLFQKSMLILTTQPLGELLLSSSWHPWEENLASIHLS